MSTTRFGDTVPYFHIAKEYGLDYGDVLTLADFATHGPQAMDDRPIGVPTEAVRNITEAMRKQGRFSELRDLDKVMAAQVRRFREVQASAPY